jgi:hypothetical protein
MGNEKNKISGKAQNRTAVDDTKGQSNSVLLDCPKK